MVCFCVFGCFEPKVDVCILCSLIFVVVVVVVDVLFG